MQTFENNSDDFVFNSLFHFEPMKLFQKSFSADAIKSVNFSYKSRSCFERLASYEVYPNEDDSTESCSNPFERIQENK